MTRPDPRCSPLIEVDLDQIRALLAPAVKDNSIIDIQRVEGGLVNTIYRINLREPGASLCLRIFARGEDAWKNEMDILECVSASLPVPEVLFAAGCGQRFPYPYLVYQWIEGITLNECRRQNPASAFLSLAEPLGRLLARIASFSFPAAHSSERRGVRGSWSDLDELLSITEVRLRQGLARGRLGNELADALRHLLSAGRGPLTALDHGRSLVHGDLNGRNILVAPGSDDDWRVTALLDWEAAFAGSSIWDLGSLFQYSGRYTESFRARFECGYREAGGALPEDWWRIARLLHGTRIVETLNEPRELPVVFQECRDLIGALVAEEYEAVTLCN